ncbi:MAG: NACHT domain-containing protein [Symploca sp. SIO2C1]|nr:NACHT domain-containing protein [Symploca sp. SIO2C1]
MATIQPHPKVFEQLKQAYAEKCGSSPTYLIDKLNHVYEHDLHSNSGLISDKTIRNFFKATTPPNTQEKNLNYLCDFLLEFSSYQAALSQLVQKQYDIQGNFLNPYIERIKGKCGTIKVPHMTNPRPLSTIYTDLNILENIKRRRRKYFPELLTYLDADDSQSLNRFGLADKQNSVAALEAVKSHSRLMIWGKPGAGKTTFLQYLALYFLEEKLPQPLVPVFIRLKTFIEDKGKPTLTDAIIQEFAACIPDANEMVEDLLKQGQCLILLDGLDEVVAAEAQRVYQNIDTLIEKYPKNRFVITCRFGASEYVPPAFKEVEMADFDQEQVAVFVKNWFQDSDEPGIDEKFLEKLTENRSIQELATQPLLLTMLCWVYEDGYEFPKERNSLYEDAVDLFIRKWDAFRRIERDSIYKGKLSRPRRISLFANIAYDAFHQKPKKNFWKRRELEKMIRNFIENIPGVEPETLDLDSREVLRAIESQHGLVVEQAKDIYSFSHLTFQEYFTARYVLESQEPDLLRNTIQQHFTDRHWREVFLMIAERLPKADEFLKLLFCHANALVKSEALQKMLCWLDRITLEAKVSSNSWRACYLAFDLETDLYIERTVKIDTKLAQKLSDELRNINLERKKIIPRTPKCKLELDLAVIHALARDRSSHKTPDLKQVGRYDEGYIELPQNIEPRLKDTIGIAQELNKDLASKLSSLQNHLPSNDASESEWQEWASNLQSVMINYLDIGYSVRLSEENTEALKNYLYVLNLLVQCLGGDIYASKDLREKIIDNLLLPVERIPADLLSSY